MASLRGVILIFYFRLTVVEICESVRFFIIRVSGLHIKHESLLFQLKLFA